MRPFFAFAAWPGIKPQAPGHRLPARHAGGVPL